MLGEHPRRFAVVLRLVCLPCEIELRLGHFDRVAKNHSQLHDGNTKRPPGSLLPALFEPTATNALGVKLLFGKRSAQFFDGCSCLFPLSRASVGLCEIEERFCS